MSASMYPLYIVTGQRCLFNWLSSSLANQTLYITTYAEERSGVHCMTISYASLESGRVYFLHIVNRGGVVSKFNVVWISPMHDYFSLAWYSFCFV